MEIEVWNISTLPPIRLAEVLRYAGVKDHADLFPQDILREIEAVIQPRVCFCELPVHIENNMIDFGAVQVTSENLATALKGCDKAVLFAATVGIGVDRLINRYSRLSPAKALWIQAVGNERIETVCDAFQSAFPNTRPRFSPGYGDLPLSFQWDVFALLDCPRKIGLTLNDSLLMTPVKSVTAIFGIQHD